MYGKTIKLTICLLLGTVSIIGDKLVAYNESNHLLRGIIDNATHGCVAGLSWMLIVLLLNEPLVRNIQNILFCAILSSFVDTDHFVEARSFNIDDVINLDRRPFFHCTTLPILIWATLIMVAKIVDNAELYFNLNYYAWIVLTSFLSHHIRDGTRRGLWIFPFGSTRRIPYYLYLLLTILLPYFVYYLSMDTLKKSFSKGGVHIV